jgi:two-component system nitrate/nitrite response regulator NarL
MDGSGITAAKEISSSLPGTAVVMLTVSTDVEDLLAALRAGASGYVLKGTDPEQLSHALQRVLAGEFALPRSLVTRAVEASRQANGARRFPALRPRADHAADEEWTTLELLGDGFTTAEVAERLSIPRDQVRARVSALQPVG